MIDFSGTKRTPKTISYEEDDRFCQIKEARRQRQSYFRLDNLCVMMKSQAIHGTVYISTVFSRDLPTSLIDLAQPGELCVTSAANPINWSTTFAQPFRTRTPPDIGFTAINPLVTGSEVLPMSARKQKVNACMRARKGSPIYYSRYKDTSQEVKFRKSNPLTFQQVNPDPEPHRNYRKLRLKNLIDKRYPKGMAGVDNP